METAKPRAPLELSLVEIEPAPEDAANAASAADPISLESVTLQPYSDRRPKPAPAPAPLPPIGSLMLAPLDTPSRAPASGVSTMPLDTRPQSSAGALSMSPLDSPSRSPAAGLAMAPLESPTLAPSGRRIARGATVAVPRRRHEPAQCTDERRSLQRESDGVDVFRHEPLPAGGRARIRGRPHRPAVVDARRRAGRRRRNRGPRQLFAGTRDGAETGAPRTARRACGSRRRRRDRQPRGYRRQSGKPCGRPGRRALVNAKAQVRGDGRSRGLRGCRCGVVVRHGRAESAERRRRGDPAGRHRRRPDERVGRAGATDPGGSSAVLRHQDPGTQDCRQLERAGVVCLRLDAQAADQRHRVEGTGDRLQQHAPDGRRIAGRDESHRVGAAGSRGLAHARPGQRVARPAGRRAARPSRRPRRSTTAI